jgi:hypothetical protein
MRGREITLRLVEVLDHGTLGRAGSIRKRDDVSWERFSEVIGRAYRHCAELHPEDAPAA